LSISTTRSRTTVGVPIASIRPRPTYYRRMPRRFRCPVMTDNRLGTLHSHLHVKVPRHYRFPGLEARIYPRLHAVSHVEGANLRFKDPEVVRRNGRLATRTGRSTWM